MEYFLEKNPIPIIQKELELLQAHKDEAGMFGDDVMLSPDWRRYANLSEVGAACLITAKDDEGIIRGYTVNFLHRHIHYDLMIAVNDIIYLQKGYRGHAIHLLKRTERLMKNAGAEVFSICVKPHIDFRPVLEKLGYNLLEYVYFRRL